MFLNTRSHIKSSSISLLQFACFFRNGMWVSYLLHKFTLNRLDKFSVVLFTRNTFSELGCNVQVYVSSHKPLNCEFDIDSKFTLNSNETWSSGFWRHVVLSMVTNIQEKYIAAIFRSLKIMILIFTAVKTSNFFICKFYSKFFGAVWVHRLLNE
jgi:hypothetical protein